MQFCGTILYNTVLYYFMILKKRGVKTLYKDE